MDAAPAEKRSWLGRLAALGPGGWIAVFVTAALALRLERWLLRYPLWGDEAFLGVSFLTRDYAGMLQPLEYHQVCPPLFMMCELAVVQLFGFHEQSLRLLPLLASLGSVLLFARLACRVRQGWAAATAVGFFCASYYPMRYGVECKPYATDLFLAVLLLTLAVEALTQSARKWPWWMLAAVIPFAVWMSYPIVYLAGGVSLALAAAIYYERRWDKLPAWITFNGLMVGAFGLLLATVIRSQHGTEQYMQDYWADAFPPRAPLPLLGWLAEVHTSHMFAYPFGHKNGGSVLTTLLCLIGLGAILGFRRTPQPAGATAPHFETPVGRTQLLLLLLVPFALGLIGSIPHGYPYGGSPRLMQYVAPAVCLLAAGGVNVLFGIGAETVARPAGLRIAGGLAAAALVGMGIHNAIHPYKTRDDRDGLRWARDLWEGEAGRGELVCIRRELQVEDTPFAWENGWTALHRCQQAIYSERGAAAPLPTVTAERPLIGVLAHGPDCPFPERAFARWKAEMEVDFELVRQDRLPAYRFRGEEWHYDVFEFRPRRTPAIALRPNVPTVR